MQRDRLFAHYEDLDTRYDRKPSVWVVPKGDWGRGSVELVQIPTKDATNDNVVAYWVPAQSQHGGSQLDLESTLIWKADQQNKQTLALVAPTRRDRRWPVTTYTNTRKILEF